MRYLIFASLVFVLIGCEKQRESSYAEGNALGTSYHIRVFDNQKIENLPTRIDSVFDAVNQSISTYIETSDISKINKGDSTVRVDKMFRDNFNFSKIIHRKTNAYLDPTVGNLVNLYGFGAEKLPKDIDSTVIDSMMQYVGIDKIKIDKDGNLRKENPNVYIEFNAIGKGYAVDKVADFLKSKNIKNFLVEVGGEIYAEGKNIDSKSKWRVGIDNPLQKEGEREISSIISLENKAMATSGNYRKFRVDSVTGQKYVHTINPKTGYPSKTKILSATVVAENCALADGYATAFMAMPLEEAKAIIKTIAEIDVLLIYDEGGALKNHTSKNFSKYSVD